MLYLIFTLISGAVFSFLFLFLLKKHIKKNGTVKEKSFIVNTPTIFGTLILIFAVVFVIGYVLNGIIPTKLGYVILIVFLVWSVFNPSAFAQNEPVNKIVFILFIVLFLFLLIVFFRYFHVLVLPLSIGLIILTLFLKKSISKIRFLYCILTNVIAFIVLFILNYLILNK